MNPPDYDIDKLDKEIIRVTEFIRGVTSNLHTIKWAIGLFWALIIALIAGLLILIMDSGNDIAQLQVELRVLQELVSELKS